MIKCSNGTVQKIHKLVRRNTIRAFDCCAGHHQSFFLDPKDGTILKKNSGKVSRIKAIQQIFLYTRQQASNPSQLRA